MSELIKQIFVPTDFSTASAAALQYAIYIANRTNSRIHLVHFANRDSLMGKKNTAAAYKKNLRALEGRLEDMKNFSGAAFRIETHVITTSESILPLIHDYGLQIGAALACIGTFGADSKPSKNTLGNNTEKLVKSLAFPVLTCSEVKAPIQFKNFLLPIDLTKYTSEKVERIIRFAKGFDATIHLVAVSELLEEFISSRAALEEKMEEAADVIRKHGLKCTTEVIRHDVVSNSILTYAAEIDADLLVIMSHAENKFNNLIFGSRINKVISHAEIPVLSFRPEDDEIE